MHERFGAVIPAYNASAHLDPVIGGVLEHLRAGAIVVVDDGSQDDTASVAQRRGVHVIKHGINRGKGNALKTGFEDLLGRPDIEAIFTLDADGQHDPGEIPAFIDRYNSAHADLIIGSRMDGRAGMPVIRKITNFLTSAIISLRTGYHIPDSQYGYRLIRSTLLRRLELVTSYYDLESEILIKACKERAVIVSIPSRTIYADEKSTINPFRDTMRFLQLVFRSLFW
jgi:glycosyltransferase involved in cell wall biosynthesis